MNRKGPWQGYRRKVLLSPSRLPLREHFHLEREVLVRGRKKLVILMRQLRKPNSGSDHLKTRLLRPGDAFLSACKSLNPASLD